VYFPLIEDQLGVRPTYGVIACGDGWRYQVDSSDELRAWSLDVAKQN
jgi:hypothetical protein